VKEGQVLEQGALVAIIDSTQLYLKKKQLESTIGAIYKKLPDKARQIAVYDEQIATLEREEQRMANLVKSDAAPTKRLDDLKAQVAIAKKQRAAGIAGIDVQSSGILAEIEPLQYQILQLKDQLDKCRIYNPGKGIVTTSYVNPGELVMAGKPLYRIAPTDTLILRVYVAGNQLQDFRIGQTVDVMTDLADGELKKDKGIVTWVSAEAEFTPKSVQTREERVTQVYAVKINVPNDGRLKIGMPAEIYFANKQ
jgi:HlyD family secretion protein